MKKSTLAFASGLFSYTFIPGEALPYLAVMLVVVVLAYVSVEAIRKAT